MDEFRAGLEMTTTEELEGVTSLLFHRRLNPLDYVMGVDSKHLPFNDRPAWVEQVDQRFRFLAADGVTVLKRTSQTLPYRQILLAVCQYFKLTFRPTLATIALEEEVFLHMLNMAYQKLPPKEQSMLEHYFHTSVTRKLGQKFYLTDTQQSLRLVLKGSSAVVLSSVLRPLILRHLASKIAIQMAQYQMTQQALIGGNAVLGAINKQIALKLSQRGIALNIARYGAIRGFFSILGPAMWTWFLADLGWRAIATNYGRILPVIFSIAQIRLLRGESSPTEAMEQTSLLPI